MKITILVYIFFISAVSGAQQPPRKKRRVEPTARSAADAARSAADAAADASAYAKQEVLFAQYKQNWIRKKSNLARYITGKRFPDEISSNIGGFIVVPPYEKCKMPFHDAKEQFNILRFSALHTAVARKKIHCVRLLIQFHKTMGPTVSLGSLDMSDREWKTPLRHAVEAGWTVGVETLINAGVCFINSSIPNSGKKLIHVAVEQENVEIARLLVEAGANIHATYGEIFPMQMALRRGNIDLVKLFLKHNAHVFEHDKTIARNLGYNNMIPLLEKALEKRRRFGDRM